MTSKEAKRLYHCWLVFLLSIADIHGKEKARFLLSGRLKLGDLRRRYMTPGDSDECIERFKKSRLPSLT